MPPLTILIKPVSSACNMRCGYCFYADVAEHRAQRSMGRMTAATLENLVRKALRYADGQVTFAFQGGEPTLAGTEFYQALVDFQRVYNVRGVPILNTIQTNGCRLEDGLLDLFARERFLVGVSFDGTPELHDRLRRDSGGAGTSGAVEGTIRRLRERGVAFNILCVVNRHVAARPGEAFEYLRQFGYIQYISCLDPLDGGTSDYSLTPEDYTVFLKKTFDRYYQSFRRGEFVSIRTFDNYLGILSGREPESCAMCGRCGRYYLVEADGGVYPCDFYVLDRWRMGNINADSFFRLEKSPVGRAFREESYYVSRPCRACRWYPLCRGGCRRDREPFVDGRPGLNKWCRCYRELFAYGADRMAEMAKIL